MQEGFAATGGLFALAVVGQVIGASLLPMTRGFSRFDATAFCLVAFAAAMWAMAQLIAKGVNLSLVVPIMASTVPLVVIAVAFLFYGESAPLMKILLLVVATGLIALASYIS